MNPVCNRSAKKDLVKHPTNPRPPKNLATVGRLPMGRLQNINPQSTPAKAYTKRVRRPM